MLSALHNVVGLDYILTFYTGVLPSSGTTDEVVGIVEGDSGVVYGGNYAQPLAAGRYYYNHYHWQTSNAYY